jgi:hypothetical protein
MPDGTSWPGLILTFYCGYHITRYSSLIFRPIAFFFSRILATMMCSPIVIVMPSSTKLGFGRDKEFLVIEEILRFVVYSYYITLFESRNNEDVTPRGNDTMWEDWTGWAGCKPGRNEWKFDLNTRSRQSWKPSGATPAERNPVKKIPPRLNDLRGESVIH